MLTLTMPSAFSLPELKTSALCMATPDKPGVGCIIHCGAAGATDH
jgi:hypothetical protein